MRKHRIIIYSLLSFVLALGMVACTATDESENSQLAYLSPGQNGYWQVWVMDTATGKSSQVSKSAYDKATLSWYPDGKRLLINGGQGELVVLSLTDGQETSVPIPSGLVGFNDAILSPDGKKIAFSLSLAESRGNNDIWIMASDGTEPRKLTNMSWYQGQPSWSSDSQTLYFTSGRFNQVHDIWALNLKTGDQQQITQSHRYNFDISDLSGRLLFSSNRDGNYDIWLQNPKGKTEKLTKHEASDSNPNWSPDGKEIVFESTRDGRPQLYILDLTSREVQQMTKKPQGARQPKWFKRQGKE